MRKAAAKRRAEQVAGLFSGFFFAVLPQAYRVAPQRLESKGFQGHGRPGQARA